jgi:hydrogenase maturation protease
MKSPDILVFGYGNELRGDDAAGLLVAEAVSRLNLAGVRTITSHQLLPEFCEPIAYARAVIFVDASVEGRSTEVEVREIQPDDKSQSRSHLASPPTLLALAKSLYGRCPPAWLVTIPAHQVGLGQDISVATRQGIATGIETIKKLTTDRTDYTDG